MMETRWAHGTVVAGETTGVLIRGASGTGKSGLALNLIARGARLVADDRVMLEVRDGRLLASAPPPLAGLIEARGLGLLRLPHVEAAEIGIVVDLDHAPEARMPQPRVFTCLGVEARLIFGRGLPNLGAILTLLLQNSRLLAESLLE